jgi:hypothetical protein
VLVATNQLVNGQRSSPTGKTAKSHLTDKIKANFHFHSDQEYWHPEHLYATPTMSEPTDLYSGLQEALRNQQLYRHDDLDDIDEGNDADYLDEDSESSYDADLEWEESKEQINMLLSMVIFPFVGKWLGRKFSFWGKKPMFEQDSQVYHTNTGVPSLVKISTQLLC